MSDKLGSGTPTDRSGEEKAAELGGDGQSEEKHNSLDNDGGMTMLERAELFHDCLHVQCGAEYIDEYK